MSSSNLRYACGALAALILLVALPTLSHAHRSPISHDLDSNSGTALGSDRTKSLKDNSLTDPQWVTATVSLTVPLARHASAIVKTESGETLCAIAGGTADGEYRQAYCYPLKASGEPDISGDPAFSLTEPLRFLAATVVDNHIYILGGEGTDTFSRDEVYCVKRDNGTWKVDGAGVMTQTVMQHAVVTVDDKIYVIGGYEQPNSYDPPNVLTDVWSAKVVTGCVVFDKDSWQREASLQTGDSKPYKISGHAAASAILDNGKKFIYVIGGLDGSDTPTNKVLRAEIGSDKRISRWDDLGTVKDMPGTWLLTAVAAGRHLYVLGGTTTPPGTLQISSDEVYSAEINDDGSLDWDHSLPDLPVPLYAHATATSKSGYLYVVGGISSNIAQQKIYFIRLPPPWLSFEKRSEPPRGPVTYGDTISYTLKLTNLGFRDLGSLTITDTVQTSVPASLTFPNLISMCHQFNTNTITCSVPSLAITETKELTYQVSIYSPTITLLCAPPSLQTRCAETEQGHIFSPSKPGCFVDLSLQKSSDQSLVAAGQTLTYTLVVSNAGPSTASNVQVSDTLPEGVAFESAMPPPSSTSPLMWFLGPVLAGERREIQLTVQVDPGASGTLTNTAKVSSYEPDFDPSNNQAQTGTVVVTQADLRISKGDYPDPVMARGTLVYSLTVYNAGPSNAQGVVVTDTLPAGVTFFVAAPPQHSGPNPLVWNLDVPAGQSREIQVVATIPLSSTGVICNEAEVSSDIDPSPSDNIAQECTAINGLADLVIEKMDEPDPVMAGERLTYTLVITNTGPSTATNVIVTDSLPAGTGLVTLTSTLSSTVGPGIVTWYTPTLEQGESEQLQLVVQVYSDTKGTLFNEAEVTSDVPDSKSYNNKAYELTAVNNLADLHLEKSHSPGYVLAGNILTYTLVVSNEGPSPALDVMVIDQLPTSTQFITATSSVITGTDVVTWTIPPLPSGDPAELQLVVQTDPGIMGCLLNTATVASSTPDSNPRNNTGIDCALTYMLADLSIGMRSDPDRIVSGETLTYTLVVTNGGPSAALDVMVIDVLPAGTQFITATSSVITGTGVVTWPISTLASDGPVELHLVVQTDSGIMGCLLNIATVASSTPDSNLWNNTSTNCTDTPALADLGIEKHANSSQVVGGERLTYTLVVTNGGPLATSNVIVMDVLPTGMQFITATPPVITGTGVVTWPISTLASDGSVELHLVVQTDSGITGCLLNIASVASDTPDGNPRNNSSANYINVCTTADLGMEKHGDPQRVVNGDTLTYVLQINNNGPSDAPSVVVTDALPAGVTFHSSTPSPTSTTPSLRWYTGTLTASTTWAITVVGVANYSARGLLINAASVTSGAHDNNPGDNCAEEQTKAPVPVVNKATVCEGNLWCLESNTVIISPNIYLPIIFKAP